MYACERDASILGEPARASHERPWPRKDEGGGLASVACAVGFSAKKGCAGQRYRLAG